MEVKPEQRSLDWWPGLFLFLIGCLVGANAMLAIVDEELLQTLRELEAQEGGQTAFQQTLPLLATVVALLGFVLLVFIMVRKYRTGEWLEQERGDGSE